MLLWLSPARWRERVRTILALFAVSLLALCRPAVADDGPRSAEDVRVQQALQTRVGDSPQGRLYVAEVVAALGQPATADALRAALLDLQWRVLDGGAVDPAETLGSLLPPTPEAFPLGPESAAARAWEAAVAAHVRLRFLDAPASAAHPLAEADRAGRAEVAPGMWVSSAPVGSMVLFVRAHQQPQASWVLTRLHVAWLGAHLECTPVQGLAAREQDALLSCEGNSRAAELAPRVRAVTARPRANWRRGHARRVRSPRATSAWIDVLGGAWARTQALLQRGAACENAATRRAVARPGACWRRRRNAPSWLPRRLPTRRRPEARRGRRRADCPRGPVEGLELVLRGRRGELVHLRDPAHALPGVLTVLIHLGVTMVLAIVAWWGDSSRGRSTPMRTGSSARCRRCSAWRSTAWSRSASWPAASPTWC